MLKNLVDAVESLKLLQNNTNLPIEYKDEVNKIINKIHNLEQDIVNNVADVQ
jgi:hypothetical protein